MIEIILRDGEVVKIDDHDSWALSYQWYLNRTSANTAYARNRKLGYLHRLILNPPKNRIVDHINGDTLDNRRENLRIVTAKLNTVNRPKPFVNTSGYKGVIKVSNGWRAQIKNDGRFICLGKFDSPVRAALAYDLKAIELWPDHAFTNFPREILKLIDLEKA